MPTKVSHFIRRKTVQQQYRAVDFAIHQGRAFNRYIVININDPQEPLMWQKLLGKYRRWLEYKRKKLGHDDNGRLRPCHLYTRENENGLSHVNWMVWVPEEHIKEFNNKLIDWALKIEAGNRFDIKNQAIKPGTEKQLANYILKDCDPSFRDHFYLNKYTHDGGRVVGPRTGMSPTIARAAQRREGFVARRDRRRVA